MFFCSADCDNLGIPVDVYLLIDCSTDATIRDDIWDFAYYLASAFYPRPSTGARLWLVSTSNPTAANPGQPSMVFNPTHFSLNEEAVLTHINSLRHCNANSRSTLSEALTFMGNNIAELSRNFLAGVITDRSGRELMEDADLLDALDPYHSRWLGPFLYYTGEAVSKYLRSVLIQSAVYRPVFPVAPSVAGVATELCSLLTTFIAPAPTPMHPAPAGPTAAADLSAVSNFSFLTFLNGFVPQARTWNRSGGSGLKSQIQQQGSKHSHSSVLFSKISYVLLEGTLLNLPRLGAFYFLSLCAFGILAPPVMKITTRTDVPSLQLTPKCSFPLINSHGT